MCIFHLSLLLIYCPVISFKYEQYNSFVYSTVPGGYGSKSGTSMACPHVAGVAALLVSHFPECTNNQIRNAMIGSTREPPTGDSRNSPGWDKYYGWGIVNAGKAYELLSQGCEIAGGAYPDASSQTKTPLHLLPSSQDIAVWTHMSVTSLTMGLVGSQVSMVHYR